MVVPDKKRVNDKIRKQLYRLLKRLGFDIEVDMNLKVVQYLDTELNLETGNVSLYRTASYNMQILDQTTQKL